MVISLVGKADDVAFYARLAASSGDAALVLGCADGRIALELCAQGQRVLGVDPSKSMIRSAEDRRSHEGVDPSRIRFVAADVRSFRVDERFPLVLAPQNALGLMGSLDELGMLLETVKRHLTDSGTFAFDVATRVGSAAPAPREHSVEGQPPSIEPPRPPFVPHLRERRRRPDAEGAAIHRLRLSLFESDDLEQALASAGFGSRERFGGFDGRPFDGRAGTTVVVATSRPLPRSDTPAPGR